MQYQGNSRRVRTGGRVARPAKKRKHELGREPTETRLGEPSLRAVDSRGSEKKVRALSTNVANVADGGETQRAEIENVIRNDADPNYVRRNIITKGAVIETSVGQARVTSRPGQSGRVDAVALDEEVDVQGVADEE